jgi:hypothetical protein
MAAILALRPEDDRGRKILDELEARTNLRPEVIEDGTRHYQLKGADDADLDAFDPMLDKIDRDWRSHVTNY